MTLKLRESYRLFNRLFTQRSPRLLITTIQKYSNSSDLHKENNKPKTFQELLDESPLMQFGRAPGKCVVGRIVDICNDDLYVDFGGKFEAVVKRPDLNNTNLDDYKKDSLVRLILNKFEMTGEFLGDKRHITLCEADGILLGPYIDPKDKSVKS